MSELRKLAERCEKATGPDRELDAEIAETIGEKHGRETGWCNSENGDYYVIDECAASYTASIDVAMTLVPKPAWVRMDEWPLDFCHGPVASVQPVREPQVASHVATGATLAIALCAAALRAREEDRG